MGGDVNARDLVQEVWDEVAAERARRPPVTASLPDCDRLLEDRERRYINSRYVLDRAPLDGGAGGAKAKLRARAAHFIVRVLGGYFNDEEEFLAHLVRLQNTITVHIDRLSVEVRQLEASLQAESAHLRAADIALHTRLEDRVAALEAEMAELRRLGGEAKR
jgi:hypothetical protein